MGYAELSRDMGVDKKAQKERLPLAASGLMMSLIGCLGSTFSNVYQNPLLMNYMIGAGVVITVYGLASEMKKPEEIIFINAGLNIGNLYPKIVRKQKIDEYITNYIISMPKGLCMADFNARKQIIEQGLNASVEFSFNKNLVMKTNKAELKKMYIFEAVQLKGLKIALGYNKFGLQILDFENSKMSNVIIAGTTGSGKSVCLINTITQIILTKSDVELYLFNIQKVGLSAFENCKATKGFYTEKEEFKQVLSTLAIESKRRIDAFYKVDVDNLSEYNKECPKANFKRIIVIVDELALLEKDHDIMAELKKRTAADRKCGIHYILCTQRPSTDVLDNTIKANCPIRICFATSSDQDSVIVLDKKGAENLRGDGHGLVKSSRVELDEFQNFFISAKQAKKLVKPFTEIKQKVKESEPDTSGKI